MSEEMDLLQIKIDKAKSELPIETREAIDAVDWKSAISEIGDKKKYNTEQISDIELETELVLCGLSNPNNYLEEIQKMAQIPKADAEYFVDEMNNLAFKKIKEELLKNIYKNNGSESEDLKINSTKQQLNIPIIQTKPTQEIQPKEEIVTEKLDSKLESLPEKVKDAIIKSNYKNSLYTISQNHKLNVSQMWTLEKIVIDMMLGKITPGIFSKNIQENLKLPPEENTNLVNELNDKIFKVVRENMMGTRIPPPATSKESDNDILEHAGIELNKNTEISPENISSVEKREEILSRVENPEQVKSTSVMNPTAKSVPPASQTTQAPPASRPVSSPAADPYRMPIE